MEESSIQNTPQYEAQEKQVLFHFAKAQEVLYGGAAGGGKSFSIIWDAVTFCMQNDKVFVSIFRRTYPELEKSIILTALDVIPAAWYNYNKKEHRMYFKNESILEFNYCQYDTDVYAFQSAQYQRLYFDELTHFNKFVYLYLTSRCRSVRPEIKAQIKSASNPGNIGHGWVKARFIDDAIPGELTVRTNPETGTTFTTQYIPAKLQDNKYLMEGDPEYRNRLMNLDEIDRRGLLEGDWTILKGQFFTEWRYDIHVCKPFTIPKYWNRIRCLDWGYAKPSVVLWITFSPEGQAFVYRELKMLQTPDSVLAAKTLELSTEEHISYTVADPSIWSINQFERGESIAMRLHSYGLSVMKADNARVSGWSVIHSYLHYTDEKPSKLKVFNTCPYLIESLPGLIHDEHNAEDINSKGDDHGADALRYGLMTKPLISKKPVRGIPAFSFAYWMKKRDDEFKSKQYVGNI